MGSKIIRPNKDFPIFGGASQADELKIFGTDTESTDITLLLTNINSTEGWASGVDSNGFPALSWFNAVGHTLSYITAYYLQNGIPEWVALQEYFIGSKAVASDGFTYVSKTDNNTGNTPVGDSTNWRLAFLDSANTVVYTPTADYHPATKKYVDVAVGVLAITGTATFTNVDNNIELTGIGNIGLETGDVFTITNSISNNKEFTVEVITDNDNIIVNQAHAGGTTTKSLIDEAATAGITVTLLSKWYNASLGLGQGWVDVTSLRSAGVSYGGIPNRSMVASAYVFDANNTSISITVDGVLVEYAINSDGAGVDQGQVSAVVPAAAGSLYVVGNIIGTLTYWAEQR